MRLGGWWEVKLFGFFVETEPYQREYAVFGDRKGCVEGRGRLIGDEPNGRETVSAHLLFYGLQRRHDLFNTVAGDDLFGITKMQPLPLRGVMDDRIVY